MQLLKFIDSIEIHLFVFEQWIYSEAWQTSISMIKRESKEEGIGKETVTLYWSSGTLKSSSQNQAMGSA